MGRLGARICLVIALGLANACGDLSPAQAKPDCGPFSATEPQPRPGVAFTRLVPLGTHWAWKADRLCVAGIRVYDGGFEIVGYETAGTYTPETPWYAGPSQLRDENGRIYVSSASMGAPGDPRARVFVYENFLWQAGPGRGDLLAGVTHLELAVQNLPEEISGPWVFRDIPARTGPLQARATASGRELRLYDLVITDTDMAVGFRDLSDSSGTVLAGLREPWHDLERATDDRGTVYRPSKGDARYPNNPYLYQRFAPPPPSGALLTFTIDRIYVRSATTWRGQLDLPR